MGFFQGPSDRREFQKHELTRLLFLTILFFLPQISFYCFYPTGNLFSRVTFFFPDNNKSEEDVEQFPEGGELAQLDRMQFPSARTVEAGRDRPWDGRVQLSSSTAEPLGGCLGRTVFVLCPFKDLGSRWGSPHRFLWLPFSLSHLSNINLMKQAAWPTVCCFAWT